MEHPLIGSLDELTLEELSTKINELGKKLGIAARTGNGHLCDQIRMAMTNYQNMYQQKLQESYKKAQGDTTLTTRSTSNER
jgi:hypothetical protein